MAQSNKPGADTGMRFTRTFDTTQFGAFAEHRNLYPASSSAGTPHPKHAQDSKGIERYAAAASIGLAIVEFAFVETVPLENLDES
jgi:hypothetical protein